MSHEGPFYLPEEDEDDEPEERDGYFESLFESSGDGFVEEAEPPELRPILPPKPRLPPTTQEPPRHQRSILKINPQHGTPALSPGPPVLQPANKRPLPKLVKATLPQLTSFQEISLGGNSGLPLHIQAPSFSITRQLLEGESTGESEENLVGGETRPRKGTNKRRLQQAPPTTNYPHRINKNNNISTSNLNDPGDPNSPFICPLCSKAYVHLRSLKDHMKVPLGKVCHWSVYFEF